MMQWLIWLLIFPDIEGNASKGSNQFGGHSKVIGQWNKALPDVEDYEHAGQSDC
jgi:hypothetical protein